MKINQKFSAFLFSAVILTTNLFAQNEVLTQKEAVAILSKSNPDLFKNDFNIYLSQKTIAGNSKIEYIKTISTPERHHGSSLSMKNLLKVGHILVLIFL